MNLYVLGKVSMIVTFTFHFYVLTPWNYRTLKGASQGFLSWTTMNLMRLRSGLWWGCIFEGLHILRNFCHPITSAHPNRSGRENTLQILSVKELWLVGSRKRAISAVAPARWSILPTEVRQPPSSDLLKRSQSMVLWPCVENPKEHTAMELADTLRTLPSTF